MNLCEPFVCTGSLSWGALGYPILLASQGSKQAHRKALLPLVEEVGQVHACYVADTGPWGEVHEVLATPNGRALVLMQLREYARRDPREVYNALQGAIAPSDRAEFTAQFLILQRIAFSSKAVGLINNRWASPGFNKSSAYGVEKTAKFKGGLKPQIPQLVSRLEKLHESITSFVPIHSQRGDAWEWKRDPGRFYPTGEDRVFYLDPPYAGTTGFTGVFSRAELVELAVYFQGLPRTRRVIVSEAEPIPELVALGWQTKQIATPKTNQHSFKHKGAEWVTYR